MRRLGRENCAQLGDGGIKALLAEIKHRFVIGFLKVHARGKANALGDNGASRGASRVFSLVREAADRRVNRAKDRRGPLATARAAWRRVESSFAWHGKWEQAWRQARQAFELFRPDGRLNDRAWARQQIDAACRAMTAYQWRKVVAMLRDERALSFLDRMHQPLTADVPEEELRAALVELWRYSQVLILVNCNKRYTHTVVLCPCFRIRPNIAA